MEFNDHLQDEHFLLYDGLYTVVCFPPQGSATMAMSMQSTVIDTSRSVRIVAINTALDYNSQQDNALPADVMFSYKWIDYVARNQIERKNQQQ